MRIILKKGKQKELIDLTKSKLSLSWSELGRLLGIKPNYLSGDLRFENVTISDQLYKNLSRMSDVNFDNFIEKKVPNNWGRIKGGKLSTHRQRPRKLLIKQHSSNLAEAIGIILGDGSLYNNKKHGINQLVVTGHIKNDQIYLSKFVKPLFENLFNLKFSIKKDNKKHVIRIYSQKKDVLYTLEKLGIPIGNKIKNDVGIPNWIFSSKDFVKSCIRGIVDTDGSVFPITGRNYTYVEITSACKNLRKSIDQSMKIIGLKTSKWTKNGTPKIYIANKRDISRYYNEVGFNNPYHKNRFKLLSSSPVKQSRKDAGLSI